MKIDWTQKLTSRKFWAMVANFVANILIAFNMTQNEIAQITAIIIAGGGVVAFILGEAKVDAARVMNNESKN